MFSSFSIIHSPGLKRETNLFARSRVARDVSHSADLVLTEPEKPLAAAFKLR